MQLQDVLADDLFEEHKQLYNIRSSRATFQATIFYQILKSNAKRLDIKPQCGSTIITQKVTLNHWASRFILIINSQNMY